MRHLLVRLLLFVSRYKMVGRTDQRVGIFIGAPHTSNWDFVVGLMVMWHNDLPFRVLVKKEWFVGPVGWVMRKLGGVPVDRDNPTGLVRELVKQAQAGDRPFVLVVAAEGTRGRGEYWKSGFYRIARLAKLPLIPGYVDHDTRTMGVGPAIWPTRDVKADMDAVRAFYADKGGVKPKNKTTPRLREEDKPQRLSS